MEHQTQTMAPLFQVENVSIAYKTKRGPLQAVKGASFSIGDQEAVALIGESGCGKTTLATSIVRALPNAASVTEGKMLFRQTDGTCCNILDLSQKELRKILWEQISMVFQASQSSFNPVKRIKTQFIDTVKAHKPGTSREEIMERAPVAEFFNHPRHPYSKGLINAIPRLTMDSSELYSIPGSPPDMIDAAPGCPFAPRCGHCVQKCREEMPPLERVGEGGHVCACWNPMMGGTEHE